MRQQQDKEFDSRVREKMRNFSATPPASLWENIDREINSPAVSRKRASRGWLKIAASVCLLAAAGFWLLQYRGPFEKEVLSINAEQDSVSRKQDSGVRVFNNSRRRGERPAAADPPAGDPEGTAAGAGAQPADQPVVNESSRAGASGGTNRSGGTSPFGEPGSSGASGGADASGAKQAPGTDQTPEVRPEPASGTEPDPVLTPGAIPAEDDRLRAVETDVSRIAALSGSADIDPDLAKASLTAAGEENERQEERLPALRKKIMEMSGVEKALDVVAAAVDSDGDQVLSVAKNKTSGKWNGVSLDLGLVTISYKKPAKDTNTDKN